MAEASWLSCGSTRPSVLPPKGVTPAGPRRFAAGGRVTLFISRSGEGQAGTWPGTDCSLPWTVERGRLPGRRPLSCPSSEAHLPGRCAYVPTASVAMTDQVLRVARTQLFKTVCLYAADLDTRLSWKAVGVHHYLVTRPDGWRFNREDIVNRHSDGIAAVKAALTELREGGYLRKVRRRRDDGSLSGWDWFVSEVPLSDEEWRVWIEEGCAPKVEIRTVGTDGRLTDGRKSTHIAVKKSTNGTQDLVHQGALFAGGEDSSPWPKSPKRNGSGYSYPEDFEAVWSAYPRRSGPNPKLPAYRALRSIMKGGGHVDSLLSAAKHYAAWCRSSEAEGTRFVMQAVTFFGPSEAWREFVKRAPESSFEDAEAERWKRLANGGSS